MSGWSTALGASGWFCYWHALYLFLRFCFNPLAFSTYKTLNSSSKSYWTASMVSSTMAVTVCCMASQTFYELDVANDLFARSATSTKTIHIFMGYLMNDTLLSLIYASSWPRWKANVLHHVVGLVSMFVISSTHFSHGFAMRMMATEVTGPFVNQIYFFTVAGMKSSRLYIVNGIIAVVLYFPFRILNMTWIAWRAYVLRDQLSGVPLLDLNIIIWSWVVTYVLQFIWFHKIAQGALKLLKSK